MLFWKMMMTLAKFLILSWILIWQIIPVQKNYVAVLRPFYPKGKPYIDDLLSKNLFCKSDSPYRFFVVCVRKKDQSLRLCVDFRALNQKPAPDHHHIPRIPRIQETLDNLGSNARFSVLDQGKAYHKGSLVKVARNKSATAVASKLYDDFILCFGFPTKIHHDQGEELENNFFDHLQNVILTIRVRRSITHMGMNK